MDILLLNETEVQRLLDPDALLDQLSEGFRALSSSLVEAPKRIGVSVPDTGFLLTMPAYQQGREITVKLVSVFHDNQRLGIPTHQALICLFDQETGTPVSVMDGSSITALRTAGAAALATQLLARTDTRVLAIIGAGVQGRAHLNMLPHVRRSPRSALLRVTSPMPSSWRPPMREPAQWRLLRRPYAGPTSCASAPMRVSRWSASTGSHLACMSALLAMPLRVANWTPR
jgi:ornithine cyclodeaminase/alanine dehydrogenase-like protein (mu-crystallin family)